ncbi:ChaB family protein [Janthinobacterium sp.]|uniref:ChaB family protein n=1 Tax=Janthinobacterium sp. TaxID=1871054 RepID=UPI00293D8595|nr:ChaB family protein [Janthinobacterium sp.]
MPYQNRSELPDSVLNVLPVHAQDIYLEAFNHAWDEYADEHKRRDQETREETAHKVAWAAVKKTYKKNEESGKWQAKKSA